MRCSASGRVLSPTPSTRSVPSAGLRLPARILKRLDFPAPFRPVTISASPAASENEIPSKTRRPERRQARFSASIRTRRPFAADAFQNGSNHVAGGLEMIYTASGCAARPEASDPPRAQSDVRAPPGRRALFALRPSTSAACAGRFVCACPALTAREDRRGNARQFQQLQAPACRGQVLYHLLSSRRREERPFGRVAPALLDEGAAREPA